MGLEGGPPQGDQLEEYPEFEIDRPPKERVLLFLELFGILSQNVSTELMTKMEEGILPVEIMDIIRKKVPDSKITQWNDMQLTSLFKKYMPFRPMTKGLAFQLKNMVLNTLRKEGTGKPSGEKKKRRTIEGTLRGITDDITEPDSK